MAGVDSGRQVPNAGALASMRSSRVPAAQAVSAAPGGQGTVSLTLHATGPQPAGRLDFLHAVSPQRPTWFEFQLPSDRATERDVVG
ncbi:MAG: hypothetical protein INH37_00750 [Myxococcaceae bacterium]|jgi:hypothetical protein|nr:hypothetical protein [Myxococcaceae bacterium]